MVSLERIKKAKQEEQLISEYEKIKSNAIKIGPVETPNTSEPTKIPGFITYADIVQSIGTKPVRQTTQRNVDDFRKSEEKLYGGTTKTPIDQRIRIGPETAYGSTIGMNIIPAYEEDPTIAKIGKGIVNYGIGGALSLIGNIMSAPQQAAMQIASNIGKAIKGEPLDFSEKSLREDILPAAYDEALKNLAAKGKGGAAASQAIDMLVNTALDPTTYIFGGILDDLARAGIIGKASKPSTEMVRMLGETQERILAREAAKQAKQAAKKASSVVDDVTKTVNDIPPIGGQVDDTTRISARIFGETPRGEIPEGMTERGFSRNIRTDTAMPDDIRQVFDENPLVYKQINNQTTLAKAEKIMEMGEEVATAEFYRSIGAKEFKPETVPLAKLLAKQANEAGDVAKARQILSLTAEKLTEAGQFTQAAKILREADPETFLMTIDRQIKKLNEQGTKLYKKKWKNIDLLPDEITAIRNIPVGNQQVYEEVWEQIGQRIAKELPSTAMEKFDAWRRMAMLLNPKTHIRNIVGNVIMSGMRKVSDTIGAALEKVFGVKTGERTKSFGWSFNKKIASKVDETWDAVKKNILGESRWEIDNLRALGREKRIFKNPALQWLNEFSLKTLNAEDNVFTKRAFKDALGQYMQANKLTEATDAAIEYAKRRALEATFKQANELASTLNRWKQMPIVGRLVEGAVPFTKTPANIIMRGIEYSPSGILKALYDVKAGKTAAQVIEDLSKGLTGTGIMILGYYLGSSGWAKVERHRSQKAEGLYQTLGDQTNAINTPYGSYTFDWAQPFSIPLAMGISASEAIRNRKDGDTMLQAVWDGIAAGGDTIFNMTMLQNIREIMSSYGSPTEKIMNIPLDYLEQAIFSVFGQAARTLDPIRRSTYDISPTRQWLNTIQARIPGLSQTLEPVLDIWGREQYQGGAIQQFINPGYFKERSSDEVINEVARLYSEFQDTDMLPKITPKSFTYKGETYRLTAEQVTEFQRKMGQENYNDIARLISSVEYQRMTDEERVKRIKKIVNDNYEEVKKDIIKSSALKKPGD